MSVLPIPSDVNEKQLHPKVLELFKRKQWIQRTPEWYEVRKNLSTASDASGALGIPPFKSFKGNPREELMMKKLNNVPVQGMCLSHGIKYESEAAELAMKILGERMFEFGLLIHDKYDWLAASPDGITTRGYAVEIKCPVRRKIVPGEIPHHYVPQVQLQLEVCDLEMCYFIQYKPTAFSDNDDGEPFIDIVVVERDRKWFADNKDKLYGFWSELMERRRSHVPEEITPDVTNAIDDQLYEKSTLVYKREFETVFDFYPNKEKCIISDNLY